MRPLLRSDAVGITQLHGAQVTSGTARRKNGVYFQTLADAIATAMSRIDTVTTREARRCWCLRTSRPRRCRMIIRMPPAKYAEYSGRILPVH